MKKVVFIASMLFVSVIVYSQTENINSDLKIRFGFNLGINYSNLLAKETLPENVIISNGFGFRLGLLMDYKISKHFILSPKIEISFNKSNVDFVNNINLKKSYKIFPSSLDFMAHLYYITGKGKVKPYFLIGPDFKLPIERSINSSSIYKTNSDLAIDFGIGFEKQALYYIFAPELRYSFGLLNVNQNPDLKTLYFHNITLILIFK
ncbi:MAG: hypothetical protein A2046_01325 [Bacteroidetes bacterium GWA2_30_7]|nr:MAG: hypothetical protein A2046_01325 [Bacteroidetes bacterium GWA2_30_7]